jgi:hypothetical protein
MVDPARVPGDHDVFVCGNDEGAKDLVKALLQQFGFLPALVGRALVDEIVKDGPRWFRPGDDVFIPLEFADAAYRYGHCQIRSEVPAQSGYGTNPDLSRPPRLTSGAA